MTHEKCNVLQLSGADLGEFEAGRGSVEPLINQNSLFYYKNWGILDVPVQVLMRLLTCTSPILEL